MGKKLIWIAGKLKSEWNVLKMAAGLGLLIGLGIGIFNEIFPYSFLYNQDWHELRTGYFYDGKSIEKDGELKDHFRITYQFYPEGWSYGYDELIAWFESRDDIDKSLMKDLYYLEAQVLLDNMRWRAKHEYTRIYGHSGLIWEGSEYRNKSETIGTLGLYADLRYVVCGE